MRPFNAKEIRGTYATLLLPIREDDAIDFDVLQQQLNFYMAAGVDGVYSNGTAGEFFAQTEDEFRAVSRLLADTCSRADLPYHIGAASPMPQHAIERIRQAAEFAPSAIQVTLPDWWPPSLPESIAFLQGAAKAAVSIPLVLYNPPHAKRVLGPADLSTVMDAVPQIVGLKTGAGDTGWYAAMQPLMQRISVFVPGHALATGVLRGASGSYSNVACLHPAGAARWNRLMYTDHALALAREAKVQRFMQEAILPFRDREGFSNMALDKLLAWVGGWSDMPLRLRWPYLGIPPRQVSGLRERAYAELRWLFEQDASM